MTFIDSNAMAGPVPADVFPADSSLPSRPSIKGWRHELRFAWGLLTATPLRLVVALLCLAVAAATEPALAWLVKTTLDWNANPLAALDYWMLPVALLGIYVVRGCATSTTAHVVGRIGADAVTRLHGELFRHVLASRELGTYAAPGKLVHLIVFEVKQCADLIERTLTKLVRHILTVAALYGCLLYLDWALAMIVALVFPLCGALCVGLGRRLMTASAQYIVHNELLADTVIEKSALASVVKFHGTRGAELAAFGQVAQALRRHALRVYSMNAAAAPLSQVIAAVVFSIVVVYLFSQVAGGVRTKGEAMAFVTNLLLLLTPLKNLAELNGPILRSLTGLRALLALLDLPVDRSGGDNALSKPRGKIEFRNVGFSYGERTDDILKDLSFSVEPGEFVAVVGSSGAGKSTVIKLLSGALAPTRGAIYVDNVALGECSLEWIRANTAVVDQDIILFSRSIEENVAYGVPCPDQAAVRAALGAAQLVDYVDSLPQGLRTRIGGDGVQLSGGQRQQLAIARAFFKNAPILLLDESTASLDERAEAAVCTALRLLRHRRTTIMISHRLSSVDFTDRVLFLDAGAVAASGGHADMMKNNPDYNALFDAQTLMDRLARPGTRGAAL